jgi:predicted PurR-regulated permease PerM
MHTNGRDITSIVLAVLFIGGLIGTSLWILSPFLGPAIWATTLVVSTWPLMTALERRLWGRRSLAITLMTIVIFCVFIVPLSLAINAIVSHSYQIAGWVKALATFKVPPPPHWLSNLPLIGSTAAEYWERIAASGIEDLVVMAAPYAGGVIKWFVAKIGGFGLLFVQFLLTVLFAVIIYANGENAVRGVRDFARRLAGPRGEHSVRLAGTAIRGVALGVVLTALSQTAVGGIGLAVCGIPFAAFLTAAMFMLAIAQIGAILVMIPSVVWLYWSGSTGWGTVLLVWTIVVGTMDNIMRPILIKRGANLSLMLVFAGVVGGLIAFGLIGIFVGPVVLAVAQALLVSWMEDDANAGSGLNNKHSEPGAGGTGAQTA